jgi:hypothetical protein
VWKNRTSYILQGAILGSSFRRQNQQEEGVRIFVHKDLYFSKINISYNCKEKDLEIFALELETKTLKLIILSLHRTPIGGFNQFIKNRMMLWNTV